MNIADKGAAGVEHVRQALASLGFNVMLVNDAEETYEPFDLIAYRQDTDVIKIDAKWADDERGTLSVNTRVVQHDGIFVMWVYDGDLRVLRVGNISEVGVKYPDVYGRGEFYVVPATAGTVVKKSEET